MLACFMGFSFFSVMSASLGAFMRPIGEEFGWGRTLLSSGVAIGSATTALLSPFVGVLIDRYGSRRIALPGLVATTIAISAFSLTTGSASQWLLLWAFYAVISITVKTTVWTAAVTRSFTASQGLALGVTLSGTAAAQTVAPPLADWLIAAFGWRNAFLWLGCGWGAATLLLCWCFLHDRQPAQTSAEVRNRPAAQDLPGLSIEQAWRDTGLWRISVATLIMMVMTIGLLIHQIPILTAAGVPPTTAAWLASLSGLAGILGKLSTGVLLDRCRANWVGGVTLAGSASAFLLLVGDQPHAIISLAMVIAGYTAGTTLQISSYLTARYGGMRNFGAIYGVITSIVALGSGAGPLIAGLTFDATASYAWFLWTGAAGCLLSGFLIFTLPAVRSGAAALNRPDLAEASRS